MNITAKIHQIGELEHVGASNFPKRQIVLITDGQYPQYVALEAVKDVAENFNAAEGETITAHFNLRGREWNGKFFTNLQLWKYEKHENTSHPTATNNSDDLPF
jgi:hypothetical protein